MATESLLGLDLLILQRAPRKRVAGPLLSLMWNTLVPEVLRDATISPYRRVNDYCGKVDEELRAKGI
jgi:hypothetical protein